MQHRHAQKPRDAGPGIASFRILLAATAAGVVVLGGGGRFAVRPAESGFGPSLASAMERMMVGMDARPSGNIDRDFALMMIPHHQGALDMALAELRYGSNERMRRIAQGIVVEQRQEIEAMQRVLDQELAPPSTIGSALAQNSLCRTPLP